MTTQRNFLIVLNGASSSGKTLTAQALRAQLGASCIYTGFDEILARVQPFGPDHGGMWHGLQRSVRILWFQLTDGRLHLLKQLHREVVAQVQAGHPVIVETALMDPRALQDAAACFAPVGGLFVGMKPPLAVSEQWEVQRGDRPQGQARKHYDLIHQHGLYDLLLDPAQLTPEACAVAILQRLAGPPPYAFQQLTAIK